PVGLPGWFAWGFVACGTLGGLALILRVSAGWVAVFRGVDLLFAAYLGHLGIGWMFTAKGGGYEYPLFWAIVCFALALVGDGAYALKMRRAASTPSASALKSSAPSRRGRSRQGSPEAGTPAHPDRGAPSP